MGAQKFFPFQEFKFRDPHSHAVLCGSYKLPKLAVFYRESGLKCVGLNTLATGQCGFLLPFWTITVAFRTGYRR